MYEVQRNTGRLILHEDPWITWSWDLSFVEEMRDKDDIYEAKDNVCRIQMTDEFEEKESCFVSNSKCTIQELREWCYSQDSCRTRFVPSSVLEFDKNTEELLDVFDSISKTRLDPELLKVSRQVELDFMSRLGAYRNRPRAWATDIGIPVIPTKWVDVNKGKVMQPQYRSRLCGKELKRWDPTVPRTFASIGPFEILMFLFSKSADVETWSEWTVGTKDHVLGRIKSSLSGGDPEIALRNEEAAHIWRRNGRVYSSR